MSKPLQTKALIFCGIAFLWLLFAYASLFDDRKAYLYDPASDGVYELVLSQRLYAEDKWKLLLPFVDREFTIVQRIEFVEIVSEGISERKAFIEGMRSNSDSTFAAQRAGLDSAIELASHEAAAFDADEFLANFKISEAMIHFRTNIEANTLIPVPWREALADANFADIRPVDVTLVTRNIDRIGTTKTLVGALLLSGNAVSRLISAGLLQ